MTMIAGAITETIDTPDPTLLDAGTPPVTEPQPAAEPAPSVALAPVEEPSENLPVALPPTLPSASKWAQLQGMAVSFARSNLVKPAFRNKPDDVLLVLMYGHDLGLPVTMALAKIHIIEGVPSLSAEGMAALIVRAGHAITGNVERNEKGHPTRAVVTGIRSNGPTMTTEFTIAEAVAAGLCEVDTARPNGVKARTSTGKAKPWEASTADMLWARAVTRMGRRLFPDVLSGVSYSPEELGYIETVGNEDPSTGNALGAPPVDPTVADGWDSAAQANAAMSALKTTIREQLPDSLKARIKEMHGWPIRPRARFEQVAAGVADFIATGALDPAVWGASAGDAPDVVVEAEIVAEPAVTVPEADAEACSTCGTVGGHVTGCDEEPF